MREATTTPEKAALTGAISRAISVTEMGCAGLSAPARIAAVTVILFSHAGSAQTAAAPETEGREDVPEALVPTEVAAASAYANVGVRRSPD